MENSHDSRDVEENATLPFHHYPEEDLLCVLGTETGAHQLRKEMLATVHSPYDQRRTGRLACISFTARST